MSRKSAPLRPRHARFRAAAATVLAGSCLLLLGGCGSSEQALTANEKDQALVALDRVEQAVEKGRCKQATLAAQRLSGIALSVSQSASSEFRDAFRQSTDRLEELVAQQCEDALPKPTDGGASPPTGTTGSTETPPVTDTPAPAPTPTPDTGKPTPPDDGGGAAPAPGGAPAPAPGSGGVRPG
ncbi:MAG: hypothetical protein JHC87_08750 [Thermoleophilaceae bacterium]|nr:hypothetical protein [Thermoleophilaceae bacterium]